MNDHFNEAFFVISKDAFQAYSTSKGYKDIAKLCALVPNSNIFCITKSEEDNQDLSEVIKISRFFEFVQDKQKVGMPSRKVTVNDIENTDLQMIEKWPICQAYGLDLVGGGFFTMKHMVLNIRDQ